MRADDVRFLFAYDRWATRRILKVAAGIPDEEWSEGNRIDRRGLGGILVHALGAHERWRGGWQDHESSGRREDAPLATVDELGEAWDAEWEMLDVYLDALPDDLDAPFDGLPIWQTFAHVINHGTQHRSEAATLLTALGRSPGDLDLIDYAETMANE